MGCNSCGKSHKKRSSYVVTLPNGTQRVYATEVEAKAAATRQGGTVRRQSS